MNEYKVDVLSEKETESFLKMRSGLSLFGRPVPEKHCRILTAEGFELKGQFELTARDARSGEIEWQHSQDNLITDLGRVSFWTVGWTNNVIGFVPSKETPIHTRNSISTDGSQSFVSTNLGSGSVTPSTYTKQYSFNFTGLPPANRTLGSIYMSYYNPSPQDGNFGPWHVWAFALLTPSKTQTTTQTLEVVYKISMNPIY